MQVTKCDKCNKEMLQDEASYKRFYLMTKTKEATTQSSEIKEFCCEECFKQYINQ